MQIDRYLGAAAVAVGSAVAHYAYTNKGKKSTTNEFITQNALLSLGTMSWMLGATTAVKPLPRLVAVLSVGFTSMVPTGHRMATEEIQNIQERALVKIAAAQEACPQCPPPSAEDEPKI